MVDDVVVFVKDFNNSQGSIVIKQQTAFVYIPPEVNRYSHYGEQERLANRFKRQRPGG